MAVIDKRVYKLDIYDHKLCNNLYNCKKDEKYCKSMLKKLVFYPEKDILDMHSNQLNHNAEYDVSILTPINYLDADEVYAQVLPLENNWIGILVKNKKTGEINNQKLMYVSGWGEGYLTDEIEPALNGNVPESVYFQYLEDDPRTFASLDPKYLDGAHDEFLSRFYGKARELVTNIFLSILSDQRRNGENIDLTTRKDITLEDIRNLIDIEFKRKPLGDDFEFYQGLDMIFEFYNCENLIKLSNRYKNVEDLDKNKENQKQ